MDAVHELGRLVLGQTPLSEVFDRVAQLMRDSVPGAVAVSVTMLHGNHANTPAATGPVATALDEWQYTADGGPCLQAARTGEVVLVADMAGETRWPDFVPHAVAAGALSSLSVPLALAQNTVGAVNIYSRKVGGLDELSVEVATTLANYAAVAMSNAALYTRTATLAEQMKHAMASRAVIEQAKGILMGERRCTEDAAFDLLTQISQATNRKLRDVAAALVEHAHTPTRTLPEGEGDYPRGRTESR